MDAQRDRYECKITSYPPTNRTMKLVEQVAIDLERLSIVFSSLITSGIAEFRVQMPYVHKSFECVYVYVETGFCEYEVDERAWGTYMWPETEGGKSVNLTCQLDTTGETLVNRSCLNGGGWDMADYDACIHFLLGVSDQPPLGIYTLFMYCHSIG